MEIVYVLTVLLCFGAVQTVSASSYFQHAANLFQCFVSGMCGRLKSVKQCCRWSAETKQATVRRQFCFRLFQVYFTMCDGLNITQHSWSVWAKPDGFTSLLNSNGKENKKAVLPQGNRAMPQVFFSVEVRQQHLLQV